MKVLMIGWEYPPQITGGLGTACYWLNKALVAQGIDITFIASHPQNKKGHNYPKHSPVLKRRKITYPDKLEGIIRQDKTDQIDIVMSFSPYSTASAQQTTPSFHPSQVLHKKQVDDNAINEAIDAYSRKVLKAVNNDGVDIIHAHDWPTFKPAELLKRKFNAPVVLHVHSTELDRMKKFANASIFEIEREGFNRADKIITVSNFTKSMLVEHYGIAENKIDVIYNGVPEGFNDHIPTNGLPNFKDKIVTFCGRITQQKGPAFFLNAAYKLLEKNKNIKFIMAGDGNLRNQMIELAAEMGISKKVFFPGFLDVEEVKDLFSITDLLVMPSVSEPFGLIAVEALSADVPVIVSKESGVSEILKSICSVDYWETEELANKMDELLHNDRKAAEMVQSCKKTLETQSWNSVARQVIKVYQNQLSAVN